MELAKGAKVARSQIDQWLAGKDITLDTLGRVAAAAGVQPWEILQPDGARPTPTPHSHYPLKECAERLFRVHAGLKDPTDDTIKNRYREPIPE